MLLLELPPEILLVVFEKIPDTRTLYSFTRTCTFVQQLYDEHAELVLNLVVINAYRDWSDIVQDTVTARRSNGELDYAYVKEHCIEWIVPEDVDIGSHHSTPVCKGTKLLHSYLDVENDTESLAEWCARLCEKKSTWSSDPGISTRQSVVQALLQLQLIANRLYNVRMPAFPEHVSLRTYERDSSKHYTSRKTRDQAQDLMEDQLRTIEATNLRRMWVVMQVLQDQYLLLRRHRLRPRQGSLMDLLFAHNSSTSVWSISPWTGVQRILSDLGFHVVPARPGTSERFLGHETPHELQQKDINEFDCYLELLPNWGGEDPSDYLERFRPLMGLPYFDPIPVKKLVEPRVALPGHHTRRPFWKFGERTEKIEGSSLGRMLDECADDAMRAKLSGL